MIVPGGELNGPFDGSGLRTMLPCQVIHAEASETSQTLDLVTLEACDTELGSLPAGTPFTIRWPDDPSSRALCDAIVAKWARDGEIVVLMFGTTDDHQWVCLRASGEQLVLEVV